MIWSMLLKSRCMDEVLLDFEPPGFATRQYQNYSISIFFRLWED